MNDKQKTNKKHDVRDLCRRARTMAKAGKYREAEKEYTLALETDRTNVYALVGLGDVKRKTRQFEEAVSYYQKALEVEKENTFALAGLGDTYRGLRELDKALEVWLAYLLLEPGAYKVMTRVADGFRKKGDLEKAKKYNFMALEKKRDDPYALMGLGDIHVREGSYEEAVSVFEKSIQTSGPGNEIVALASAATACRRQRQYERAMEYCERILKIDRRNSHAWHAKADCFRGLKNYPAAIKAWQTALEYGMDPRIAITRMGDAYLGMGDDKEAEVHYRKALALGYDKYAYLGMARIHARRDQVDEVMEIFSLLDEKEPGDSRVSAQRRGLAEKYPELAKAFPGPEVKRR